MANETLNTTAESLYHYGPLPQADVTVREVVKEPSPRAKALRDLYLTTHSSVTMEFPYWYTRRWQELEGEIPIIRRAEALKAAFSHLTPVILPGELLAMSKTHYLRGSFPMPWLSESYFMSKEDELYKLALEGGMLSSDEVTKWGQGGGNVTKNEGNVLSIAGKFGIRREEMPILIELARAWQGRSVEDVGHRYEQMVPDYALKEEIMRSLICMFDSGYTLPQGREVINYYYPLQYGIDGLLDICREKIAAVAGAPEMDRLYFYNAVILGLEGIKTWIINYAVEASKLAAEETDAQQKAEYQELAGVLQSISSQPPQTFRQALQMIWVFHVAVLNEDCISGMSPGRVGQILYPWWQRDMEAGRIDRAKTLELLECMRVKFTELDCFASMGVVGGVLSGNTFNNLCLAGLNKEGEDASNELELLILESAMTCATPQPTLSLLYDERTPQELIMKGVECTKTGTGYPAWIGNRTAIEFLMANYASEGMTLTEARAWSIGGCLETSAGAWMPLKLDNQEYLIPGGAGSATSVGVHFISLPKVLELVLFDGYDNRTKKQVYKPHKSKLSTFDELLAVWKEYFRETVRVLTLCNNIQHDAWRKITPSVVNSLLKPDCLENGRDIGQMGTRFNTTFNVEVCGIINLVNSLASLKKNLYEDHSFTLEQIKAAITANFGYLPADEVGSYSLLEQKPGPQAASFARILRFCNDAPKYGNDNPYVDGILADWEGWFCSMCHDYVSLYDKPLYACQISVSTHGPMGAVTGATPDGRLAGTTFADASMSAYPGTDRNGPYALFTSATCWNHSNSQNSQLNLKIHPSAISGPAGARKLAELIKAYLRRGGFHIQFNIVDSRMLRDAQAHPENYRGLMVRVAGFTQYWVELGKPIQDEIIARTEYEEVGS